MVDWSIFKNGRLINSMMHLGDLTRLSRGMSQSDRDIWIMCCVFIRYIFVEVGCS